MITIDVDSLHDLFPDYRESEEPVYRNGLDRLEDLLAEQQILATLFVVGSDLARSQANRNRIRRLSDAGHEIANHTMNHVQGFRHLSAEKKRVEIQDGHNAIADAVGKRPIGFRAPGWNIDEETLDLLEELGYLYDSSIFPTWLSAPLKAAYWIKKRGSANSSERTTLGRLSYQWAPADPYRPGRPIWRSGGSRLLEIPMMTVPGIRVPFSGTFSFWMGDYWHNACFQLIRRGRRSFNYGLHGAEFVDRNADGFGPFLAEQPSGYLPKTLFLPWEQKEKSLRKKFREFGSHYRFVTMETFARTFPGSIS